MNSSKSIKAIIKQVKMADKIALFHHINPDGDSISCSYGLLLALKQKFPSKHIVVCGNKEYLQTNFKSLKIDYSYFVESIDSSYLTIVGDTSVGTRVEYYDEYLKGFHRICFDHHLGESAINANFIWKIPKLPASAIQAFWISEKLNVKFNEEIALNLMFGILTDTNNFKYSLSDLRSPKAFLKLLSFVSDKGLQKLYRGNNTQTIKGIELKKIIYNEVKYFKNIAYISFSEEIISKFSYPLVKQNIYMIANIEDHPIWVFFAPYDDKIKVSIRSSNKNVHTVCEMFNGGGHERACGCSLDSELDVNKLLDQLAKV